MIDDSILFTTILLMYTIYFPYCHFYDNDIESKI